MQTLPVGAMAVGPAASAFALDEGAGKHFAEGAEAAHEAAAGLEAGVDEHFLYDSHYSVRTRPSQGLSEKCENAPDGPRPGKPLWINGLGWVAPPGLRNHCVGAFPPPIQDFNPSS